MGNNTNPTYVFLKLITLLLLLLTVNPVHSTEKATEFKFSCPTTMKWRPVCLEINLESQQQFRQCRFEVEQYLSELDLEYSCIADAFTKYMNKLINKVEGHLVCHEENLSSRKTDRLLVVCEKMKREYFGIPKHKIFMFNSWDEPYSLYSRKCLERNDSNDTKFLVSCIYGWREFIANAKELYQQYLKELATIVKEEKKDTISCFNYWSRGILHSLSC
jgi:hypothetical protein